MDLDPSWAGAFELGEAIARGKLSSRELLEHQLARIERVDPRLNAVVTRDVERARAEAARADAELARGERRGSLHGVAITIKDTLETAGLRTTAGYPPLAGHVPAVDAAAVARLRAAGAIILGKTNVPLLAGDAQSYNAIFGVTRNPWDAARTPGGSSGGAAAALAAGLTPLEVGSDIGGSIRTPCHWCGVYGHKPTHGVVPTRGHIPGPPGTLAEPDLAVVGPMARKPEDLARALELLAGPLPDDATGWKLALPPPRRGRLRDWRVAAWLDDPSGPVDSEVRNCLQQAVDALRAAGVAVDQSARPAVSLARVEEKYLCLLFSVIFAGVPSEAFETLARVAESPPAGAPEALVRAARAGTVRHREWLSANEARQHVRARMAEFFQEFDLLLMPVNPVAAIPHDPSEPMLGRRIEIDGVQCSYLELFRWIALPTLALLPVTAAPVGTVRGGLPVGIQVVGPYLEDRSCLEFAARLAERVGGFVPPPTF